MTLRKPARAELEKRAYTWGKKDFSQESDFCRILRNIFVANEFEENLSSARQYLAWIEQEISMILKKYEKIVEEKRFTFDHDLISHNGFFWRDMFRLIVGYHTPHSNSYRDGELLSRCLSLLKRAHQFLENKKGGNWWAFDVGVPQFMAKILLVEQGVLPVQMRQKMMKYLLIQGYYPDHQGFPPNFTAHGANRLWAAYNMLMTGALLKDKEMTRIAFELAESTFVVTESLEGNGIMADGSYHFHGNQINMGYGFEFLNIGVLLFYLVDQMDLSFSQAAHDGFSRFLKFSAINSYKSYFNYTTKGRALSRAIIKHNKGGIHDPLDFTRCLLFTSFTELQEIVLRGFRSRQEDWRNHVFLPVAENFIWCIKTQKAALFRQTKFIDMVPYTGVWIYPTSRYLISRSRRHFLTLHMSDEKTVAWFSINKENLKGHQTGEGSIFYLTDGEDQSETTQFARPWDSTMGVTYLANYYRKKNQKGSAEQITLAALGRFGSAAMIYKLGSISGKKSYHFFDNLLVLIGSNISRGFDKYFLNKDSKIKTCVLTQVVSTKCKENLERKPKIVPFWSNACQNEDLAFKVLPFSKESEYFEEIRTISVDPKKINPLYGPDTNSLEATHRIIEIDHGYKPKDAQFAFLLQFRENSRYLNKFVKDLPIESLPGQSLVDEKEVRRPAVMDQIQVEITPFGHSAGSDDSFGSCCFFEAGILKYGGLNAKGTLLWKRELDSDEISIFVNTPITEAIGSIDFYPKTIRLFIPVSDVELADQNSPVDKKPALWENKTIPYPVFEVTISTINGVTFRVTNTESSRK